ncbi:MAG: hypothetical protein AAFY88_07030 [Acidobacteriota bacterium]
MMRTVLTLVAAVSLCGCQGFYENNKQLYFTQGHLVGIDIDGTAPNQGVSLAVGYKDFNLAIIPVLGSDIATLENTDTRIDSADGGPETEITNKRQEAVTINGQPVLIDGLVRAQRDTEGGTSGDGKRSLQTNRDTFSTFGQFQVDADTGNDENQADSIRPSVGLGKFFATGFAAEELAKGFKAKLSGQAETKSEVDNND